MRTRRPHTRGFTLLEVLVAVAILSIVLLASARNSANLLNNAAILEERTVAHFVALNKAAELRLGLLRTTDRALEGEEKMGGRRWHWQITLEETSDANLLKASISVRLAAEPPGRPATVTLFVGRSA